jgi:hypothetical protein
VNKHYIRDNDGPEPTPDEQLRTSGRRSLAGLLLIVALSIVGIACVLLSTAFAAEYTRDGGTADWQCCADKACTAIISQHADPVRAEKACAKLTDADGKTRYTRSNAFRITSSSPPPVEPPACPAKPANETRPGACPAGATGTWTQTLTYTSAASPICWTAGAWAPSSPPAGACVVTLTAPTLTGQRTVGTAASNTLTWTAVPGATSYVIERCPASGIACPTLSPIATVTELTYPNTGLPPTLSYSYRVQPLDGARVGPYSNVWTPPIESAPAAFIRINAGGSAVDGYLADQSFVGGSVSANCRRTMTGAYTTRRFHGAGFEYRIPVTNGTYVARLLWRECWNTAVGQRVLSANVEGQAIPAFDTWRADDAEIMHERAATVTDGLLNITLTAVTGDAMLNAIEVTKTGADPEPPPLPATGSATLSWTPPTENTDGSTITNLAGFRIEYGTSPQSLTRAIDIPSAGITRYVVEQLTAGSWYFAVTARASNGFESARSSVASRVVP